MEASEAFEVIEEAGSTDPWIAFVDEEGLFTLKQVSMAVAAARFDEPARTPLAAIARFSCG